MADTTYTFLKKFANKDWRCVRTSLARSRLPSTFLLIWILAAFPTFLYSGSLREVWKVDLKKVIQRNGPLDMKVAALKFSPDGQQIAADVGGSLFVILVQNPEATARKFASGSSLHSFGWSPDGRSFLSGNTVTHLGDGKTCNLPQNALGPAFISKDRIVARVLEKGEVAFVCARLPS